MNRQRLLVFALVAGMVLALLAACGEAAPTATPTTAADEGVMEATATPTPLPTATPTPTGEQPQYGGVLLRDYSATHPDPYHVNATQGGYIGSQVTNRLIEHKKPHLAQMEVDLVPGLATEWTLDETQTKWTFKLREGVTWHDGEAFDANDVKATFERALDPRLLKHTYVPVLLSIVKNMQVVDPYTIIIDTGEPNALTIPWLSNWEFPIVPEHLIRDPNPGPNDTGWRWMQANVEDPEFGKGTGTLAIGTGPFIYTNWEINKLITMKRNPNYWAFDERGNRLPYLDGIANQWASDVTRRLAMFATNNSHEIGGATGLSKVKAEVLCARRLDPCRLEYQDHGTFAFVFNDRIPPFNDPKVMEAAIWAMDRHKGISLQMGFSRSSCRWMHWAYPEAIISDTEKYQLLPWCDPSQRTPVDIWKQKAIDQLKEAGYSDGITFTYPWQAIASRTSPGRDLYGSTYTDLQAANFKFSPTTTSDNTKLRSGQFHITTAGCGTPVTDPTAGVTMAGLSWSSTVGGRPWAWKGVEQADELYTRANKLMDPIQRGEVLKDLERFYARPEEVPLSWFGWTEQHMTVPDCLRNFHYGPANYGLEHAHTWMREGYCRQTQGPEFIEPKDLNVVKTVIWNWRQ